MSKVSITQAAKMADISRSYLYKKYINPGLISISVEDGKKLIDVSELIRVFGTIKNVDSNDIQQDTEDNTPDAATNSEIVELLKTQLAEAKEREKEFQEREKWMATQIDELRKQQTYLLEDKSSKKRKKILGIF